MSARSLLLCLAVVAATVGGCGGDNGADVPGNGGGGMPAFEGRLSDDEIRAVSQYVAENAGRADSGDQGGGGP